MALSSAQAFADDQAELRQNPKIDTLAVAATSDIPPYINLSANHINMNGDNWAALHELFDSAAVYPVNILHIGDSHLQADMGTAVVRNNVGKAFSHLRGRGLIVPFKLAGTNQPVDYSITSTVAFTQSRLLKLPWPTDMRFTGIGIQPQDPIVDFTIRTRQNFDAVTIYYSGEPIEISSVMVDDEAVPFITDTDAGSISIFLTAPVQEVVLNVKASTATTFHGFNCALGDDGVAYHVVGNNGATYSTYTSIGGFGRDIAYLEPDLIIVSLGTNEAFSTVTDAEFRRQIDLFIKEVKRENPAAKILLTTPNECQRKVATRTRRRRRRKATVTYTYSVNTNVARMRNVILSYAADNHIPVYDWYEVAGGSGSSAQWIADKTLNSDRIHKTLAGYQLEGRLFSTALIEAINLNLSNAK